MFVWCFQFLIAASTNATDTAIARSDPREIALAAFNRVLDDHNVYEESGGDQDVTVPIHCEMQRCLNSSVVFGSIPIKAICPEKLD